MDANGNGIAGATVTLSDANGEVVNALVLTQISDANGDYLFTNVPPGNYTITVSIDGMGASAPVDVTVLTEQTATVPDTVLQPSETHIHLPLLRNAK